MHDEPSKDKSISSFGLFLYFTFFFFLATWHNLWDPSSLTRESNRALGSENAESQQLDCWGIPLVSFFFFFI